MLSALSHQQLNKLDFFEVQYCDQGGQWLDALRKGGATLYQISLSVLWIFGCLWLAVLLNGGQGAIGWPLLLFLCHLFVLIFYILGDGRAFRFAPADNRHF